MRRGVAVVLVGLVLLTGCADDAPDPCSLLGADLPPLDASDSATRWREIADALPEPEAASADALAVVADQVVALGSDATLSDRAAVALRPAVAEHLTVVGAFRDRRCAG